VARPSSRPTQPSAASVSTEAATHRVERIEPRQPDILPPEFEPLARSPRDPRVGTAGRRHPIEIGRTDAVAVLKRT
jgi:hypothetical protein